VPAKFWAASSGRIFVGRLATGSDLVDEIEGQCAAENVMAAEVTAIGAVRRAAYAYYEQTDQRYRELASETHHEITGFVGNVSERDGRPFLHAHATFADADGATVGGHLLRGIEVFAAEVVIRELRDVSLVRRHDAETGLSLW
jgi:predicted DNA-binding protein with PD1-like motif